MIGLFMSMINYLLAQSHEMDDYFDYIILK